MIGRHSTHLSLTTLPRHDATTMHPTVVAMTAWIEDTSLGKRKRTRDRDGKKEREVNIGMFFNGKRQHHLLHYRLEILNSVVSIRARPIYRLALAVFLC